MSKENAVLFVYRLIQNDNTLFLDCGIDYWYR